MHFASATVAGAGVPVDARDPVGLERWGVFVVIAMLAAGVDPVIAVERMPLAEDFTPPEGTACD